MYDCRQDSDALYHQHGVALVGVYDLQLAEVAARRANGEPRRTARDGRRVGSGRGARRASCVAPRTRTRERAAAQSGSARAPRAPAILRARKTPPPRAGERAPHVYGLRKALDLYIPYPTSADIQASWLAHMDIKELFNM